MPIQIKRGGWCRVFGLPGENGPREGVITRNSPAISTAVADYSSVDGTVPYQNVPLTSAIDTVIGGVVATPALSVLPNTILKLDRPNYFRPGYAAVQALVRSVDPSGNADITFTDGGASHDRNGVPPALAVYIDYTTGAVTADPPESFLREFR